MSQNFYQDTANLPHMPEDKADELVRKIKNEGKVITLPPPHSAGQRDLILWEGSGAAFCGRRWGKCLASGAAVSMADGTTKAIEDITSGDMVLSLNVDTYRIEPKPVVALMDNGVRECITVTTRKRSVTLTPNHPLLVWYWKTYSGKWFHAGALSPDYWIRVLPEHKDEGSHWDEITAIAPAGEHQTWDLEIADNHNFIADGIVVHNTHSGVQRLLRSISQRPGLYWWVGLSWKSASMKRAWRELKFWCSLAIKESGVDKPDNLINNSNFEIRLPNGAEIWLRTAERPESLAGEGIMGAVVDEFTLMPEVVWTEYLQGTLLDYEGWALFIGVPKNELWALTLWRKAMSGQLGPRWKGWKFSSYDNPGINKYLLDEMRGTVPDMIFRQEYLAEIVSESGGVFRGVRDAATAVPQTEAIPGHIYTMGVDLARVHDYTVFAVLDVTTSECVAMDRFQGVEYAVQEDRFITMYNRFKPAVVYAESNSMGGPIIESLNKKLQPNVQNALVQHQGIIVPFVTNAASKDTLIRAWAIAIETGQIKLPNDEVVIGEHQIYEMTQLAGGGWRYSSPGNEHDDTVIAHALAWQARGAEKPPTLAEDMSIVSLTKTAPGMA